MKRAMYSMYHQVATCGVLGMTCPFLCVEVAPGDTWSGQVGMLLRFSPLKRALLQDLYVDQYVFYIPHRLVWDQWENFIAQGPNATAPLAVPTTTTPDPALWKNATATWPTQLLHRRAMNLVYNEYFRDEELAPVSADTIPTASFAGGGGNWPISPKRHWINEVREQVRTGNEPQPLVRISSTGAAWPGVAVPGGTTYVSPEDILRAIAQNKLQMKRATYGTRYVDILRSYGVRVTSEMLQRPEIVATAYGSVNITDVVSTSGVTAELGKMAGHAINGSRVTLKRRSFSEHGTLLGIVCVRHPFVDSGFTDWMDGPTVYQDYYDPALELLPTQTVPIARLTPGFTTAATQIGHTTWGSWYRGQLSRLHNALTPWVAEHFGPAFRAGITAPTIDYLHSLAQGHADRALLFADVTYGHYQVSAVNAFKAARLIRRGTPALTSR